MNIDQYNRLINKDCNYINIPYWIDDIKYPFYHKISWLKFSFKVQNGAYWLEKEIKWCLYSEMV